MNPTAKKTPVWRVIADSLRRSIAEAQYREGDRLPTEAALSDRFGVNRHTVRRALAQLTNEGLVHPRRGAGVFVLDKPLDYPLSDRVRFHQNLIAAGRLPERKVLSVEVRAASKEDAHRLTLEPGDAVTVAHSLSFADSTPVALAESIFPEARLPGFAEALRTETSVTKALASVGIRDYRRVSTRLTACMADITQALHLRLPEGSPLLLTEALSQEKDGDPVEYGQTWFASDRITLTLDHTTP